MLRALDKIIQNGDKPNLNKI